MKKLLFNLFVILFALTGIVSAYFEISDGIPTIYSQSGGEQWRLWAGRDASGVLFDDSSGILFDEEWETVVVGKFTPGTTYAFITTTGYYAGTVGVGHYQSAFGWYAGAHNAAAFQSAFGASAGVYNTGADQSALGRGAGKYNEGALNTAIGAGAFDAFPLDAGSARDIASVDVANDRVTITAGGGHGFGADGTYVNLAATTTGTLPAGLRATPSQWEIISSTVLECRVDDFTDTGTGTHTLTPQFVYTNSTALGYNAEPDASNQVVLGDTNVSEVKTSGSINAGGGLTLAGSLTTGEFTVEADGDTFWTGSGTGLLYGNMDQDGGSFDVTLTLQNTLYELDAAVTHITAGPVNDMSFDGDHFLEVNTSGVYKIDWSLICQVNSVAGGDQHLEFETLVNDAAIGKGESHITLRNATRELPASSITLLKLASNDEISVGVTNISSAGKIVTIDHLEMTILMVGGAAPEKLLLETGDFILLETGDKIELEG